MQQTLLEKLVASINIKPDESARNKAAKHLLDWLGCSAYGASLERGKAFRRWLSICPHGESWNWSGCPALIDHSIAFNASLGNIAEMDDVDKAALLHPGPVIIPVVLALAEAQASTYEHLLDAIVIGYEVAIRVGRAVGTSHYRYWHNTATCGALGGAAAAAFMLKLNSQQMAFAIANTASRAGGLWQLKHEPTCATKQVHCAEAARTAWSAAQMAACDISGVLSVLEGPEGFFAALCDGANPQDVLNEQDDWLIHQCSFKPWPACRHTHPSIDAALVLRERMALSLDKIQAIEVQTFQAALDFCDNACPETTIAAKFSLQHAVAIALQFGKPQLSHFEADTIANPAISTLRKKITPIACAQLTSHFPLHFSARVLVTLDNGETEVHSVTDALGDPENPMSERHLKEKFDALVAAAGLLPEPANALADRVISPSKSKHSSQVIFRLLRTLTDSVARS